MILTRHCDFYPQTTHNLRVQPTAFSCFYLITFNNMDSTANGNNPPQGDPPHHDHNLPLLPNGNNQSPAALSAPPHTDKDLAGALQTLQLQLQDFHKQQQESFQQVFQQQQQRINHLTSIVNELMTLTAQGRRDDSRSTGPLQDGPSSVSPNYVQPLVGAQPAAAPQRNREIQGPTPLGQSNIVDPLSSNLTPAFSQPPNHVQSQPARDIRPGTTSNTSVLISDQPPNHVLINDDDGYAVNREKRETTCESIDIEEFSMSNKEQDFPIWISRFEEAVNRGFNPHSKRRHHNYCLQWLSGSLDHDAYSIWRDCENKSDWEELKLELEDKFEDPAVRREWRNNPFALKWKEHEESLQTFVAKVKRKVNRYDKDLAPTVAAKELLYYTRFCNGMPDDYADHLILKMPSKKPKLEKALEECVRFQAYKRSLPQDPAEVGASVAFDDPTMPSRITRNMSDIQRVDKCIRDMWSNRFNPTPR